MLTFGDFTFRLGKVNHFTHVLHVVHKIGNDSIAINELVTSLGNIADDPIVV